MHCLLAPAVSVVNCLFMTWNRFLTYRLLCCLKARNAWDQTPFLCIKNFCGARGVRGCTVVSLAHAFCLPASACPLKDGATCFDEWLEDDFCKLWLLRLCQLRAFSATFELIHFCDSYALYLCASDVRSFTEVANFVSEWKMSDYGAGDHSDFWWGIQNTTSSLCVLTQTQTLRQAFNRSTLDKYLLKCSVHSGHFRSTLTTASCLGHSCLWEHQRLHTTGWAPSPYFQGVLAQLPDLKPGVSLGSFLKASFELSRLS